MATDEKAPRLVLQGMLRPLLPRAWRIVPSQQTVLDTLSTTTVILKQLRMERHPAAPQGAHLVHFVVTIASPLPATEKAEDDVDDKINTLLHAIDSLGIAWTSAEKVLSDQSLAYDITLSLTSTKKNGQ
jgi:hypothetical protein